MPFSQEDLDQLAALRRNLHRHPEVSGQEEWTAVRMTETLKSCQPDKLVTGLGGHGVAAVFEGAETGPALLIRCELDALPIEEKTGLSYSSEFPGKGHLCGHDGHMTTLAGIALALHRQRPAKGRVVLLFQPAEEDGSGAAAVLADPAFEDLHPDLALSLHNLPGLPLGFAGLKTGPVNCASRGLKLHFKGKTAHASQPDTGISPMPAIAALMPALSALSKGTQADADFTLVTITHAWLGKEAFGIAPGDGEIWATLRTLTDDGMASLCHTAERLAEQSAREHGLELSFSYHDVFHHCENAPEAVAVLEQALSDEGVPFGPADLPMRASEDFGRFRTLCPAAMFFLGAGEDHPALHNPDYDFPEQLIPVGARVFLRAIRNQLG
ncbi:amidohydrolase [Roseibium litorale]|uniref:Amidohydrolase n=1 Tax=Roseibium litorale TaxID=2803841 RepID=A0ABR9CIM3_9HYPH|nr:amidohydrolase [Roseibium litorale]MBD8890669.1 amidohydrolase [Roseibium litorale]